MDNILIVGSVAFLMFLVKLMDYFTNRRKQSELDEIIKASRKINEVDFVKMYNMLEKSDDMHSRVDDDGVPVWYVRRSLEEAIKGLSSNIIKQGELLQKLINKIVK